MPDIIEGESLATAIANFADQKKAEDIRILDLRGLSSITDYFVICTGTSMPHLKAVRDEVVTSLRDQEGLKARPADGKVESQWIVLDYGDVIFHVLLEDVRELYGLEDLWSDAKIVPYEPDTVVTMSARESGA